MIRQGSWLAEADMHFVGDKNKYPAKHKSHKRKSDRKQKRQIINKDIESEWIWNGLTMTIDK